MIKRLGIITIILVLLLGLHVDASSGKDEVYVIPIRGEIGPAVYQFVRSSIQEAERNPNIKGIIFEIDTYGGRIDSASRISDLIVNSNIKTISFVNTKAESAGVLLSISSDKIVMAPGSTIGSAEPIPNTEKILSHWTSKLRSVAEENNRDPKLVAAMADKSIEIPGIISEDRLLNLTTQEANRLQFIDYVSESYEDILNHFNIDYDKIIIMDIPFRVRFAQIFSSAYLTPLLLTVGFIGLLVEILTPGFGVGGTLSFTAFALYFGSSILAGNAGWAVILLFIVGLILLTIEAFAPGFGVAGIGGLICIIISIIMAANSTTTAVISLTIAFILTIIAFFILIKFAPRNKYFNRFVLNTKESPEFGYTATSNKFQKYIGKEGVVKTYLRPAGTIEVEDETLDVVSAGEYIDVGSNVKIVKVEGRRIIVKKID